MNDFYNFFCKVEFLCYQNEPNWLGWLAMVVVGVYLVSFIFWILVSVVSDL